MSPKNNGLQEKVRIFFKLALLLGILLAVGAIAVYFGMRVAIRGTEVEVPQVVGDTAEKAQEELEGFDLGLSVNGKRYAEDAPEGTIVSQYPSAGGRIKAGQDVQVIVSLGKRVKPVPDVTGATVRAAQLMTAQAGYQFGSISEIEWDGGRGQVIQQVPAAYSTEIGSGKIDVLVSRQFTERLIMPELTGKELNQVRVLLESANLKLGNVQYARYQGASLGSVVKQFPQPGYPVSPETPIHLEVAR
ncbi:MAG: PASTA domain-containing protein [Acidobacteriota bacterium]